MKPSRLQPPWRRCQAGDCTYVYAGTVCPLCKEPAPVIGADDECEAGPLLGLVATSSSPFIER